MELKHRRFLDEGKHYILLIVPYGIETNVYATATIEKLTF